MAERLEDLRIEFQCVKCGQQIAVPVRWMGRLVRCSHCQTANRVGRQDEPLANDGGLRLPPRVAHEKYLEQVGINGNSRGMAQPRVRWGWAVWALIAANLAIAAGGVALMMR